MNEKQRLVKLLSGEEVDRPPVICPGGMMTMASREVMHGCDCRWPLAHRDATKMATLSVAMHRESGFENVGIPFCMTVEAEAWGGEVEDGDEVTEPSIIDYPLKDVSEWRGLKELDPHKDMRLPTILECTTMVSHECQDTAVIGNLVGPLSLATSLIDATTLFKALKKDPETVGDFLGFLTENSIRYGRALAASGADVITIADPSATGEILGPGLFREFALPFLNKMTEAMKALGKPVIVHICGNMKPIYAEIDALMADCISLDSVVSIKEARRLTSGKKLMGNISTLLLHRGPADRIRSQASMLINEGVDILAPACGISALTPVEHLRAMTETLKD